MGRAGYVNPRLSAETLVGTAGVGTHRSDQTRGQPDVFGQRRVMDAVRGALVGLDDLARLPANHVGMLDDAAVCAGCFVGMQLHEAAIVRVLLLAQQHEVAFYGVVSGVERETAGVLPWNARRQAELLENGRADGCRMTRRRGAGEEWRMAL